MRVYEAKITYHVVSHVDFRKCDSASRVVEYMKNAFDSAPLQESFWVILLDRKNHVQGRVMITLGTVSSSLAHPREVFRPAILAGSSSIIVVHNHPRGDPSPSAADIQVTRQLREAARIMDIGLLDHVVMGDGKADPQGKGFYSCREAGLI